MAPPKGNQFWKARSKHGKNKLWEDSEKLRDACYEYFQWVEDNPLMEQKAFAYQGVISKDTVTKMRAMTITGLCVFLGMSTETWYQYRKKDDYSDICQEVEQIIYDQKFSGASADLLNASIIARDLGLRDSKDVVQDVTATHKVTAEVKQISTEMSADEATRIYQEMINGSS